MSIKRFIHVVLVCGFLTAASTSVHAEKLYWREAQADDSGIIIKRSDLDGTNIEQLITIPTALSNPYGLALDVGNGKMYWAERENGKIRRANLDGSNPEDILTGLNLPLNIALDIADGRIYWTQDESSPEYGVYRAFLSGTGVEQLLVGDYWDIALDLVNDKMYLVNSAINAGPRRADLDGGNLETLIDPSTMLSVFGNTFPTAIDLDLDAGKMYFTMHTAGIGASSIGWADLDGSTPAAVLVDVAGEPVGFPVALVLDTHGALMYWSDILNDRITRAGTDGTDIVIIHDFSGTAAAATLALDLTAEPELPVPTLSEWGMVSMALLVLAAGTVLFLRRRVSHG